MQLTLLKGYPDMVGRRRIFCGYGNGPTSYATIGDPVIIPGYETYIDCVQGGNTVSGTYTIDARPSGVGARQTWYLVWTVAATGAAVGAGTNLSAEQVQISAFGGQY